MFAVSLKGVQLYAPIGVYPEELILKNRLEFDISVIQKESDIENLPFFNYEDIYHIVKKESQIASPLLEDLLQRIAQKLLSIFPHSEIEIEIKKHRPPLGGQVLCSSVKWTTHSLEDEHIQQKTNHKKIG